MTSAPPPPGSIVPAKPTSTQAELIDAVRHWVHFDNLAESLNKQVNNARAMKSNFEDKILKFLNTSNMKNTILQITGATLQRASRPKQTDLSWSFLESSLHEYYKMYGKSDETKQILEFIQSNRTTKNIEYLKKSTSTPTSK